MAIIWTNHLRQRLKERGLSPDQVDRTIRFPDQIKNGAGSQTFLKNFNQHHLVVALVRRGNDWIIKSAWKKPYLLKRNHSQNLLEKLIHAALLGLENLFRG